MTTTATQSKIWAGALFALIYCIGASSLAQNGTQLPTSAPTLPVPPTLPVTNEATACLPSATGFLRARLAGAIRADLSWNDASLECNGATRPKGGVRMRFVHPFVTPGQPEQQLVFLFGIPGLREGLPAQNLSVNITVIRQGAGQFFGTQGDKCTIDQLQQEPLAGIPLRNRSYRVTARGFCMQPIRAVRGDEVLHLSRFDFAGRIDFSSEDRSPDDTLALGAQSTK